MKIVFESEEEKNDILKAFAYSDMCPSDIGLTETFLCSNGVLRDECIDCWKNSGLEIAVTDKDYVARIENRLERLRKFFFTICEEDWDEVLHNAYGQCVLTPEDISFLCEIEEDKTPKCEKPPLGIMPKYIWDKKREKELSQAMIRYISYGKEIPAEWVEEYNELAEKASKKGGN